MSVPSSKSTATLGKLEDGRSKCVGFLAMITPRPPAFLTATIASTAGVTLVSLVKHNTIFPSIVLLGLAESFWQSLHVDRHQSELVGITFLNNQ